MLIKMKISSYFEFWEFDSLRIFEDYNFIEDLVLRKCFLDIDVNENDIKVYKELKPDNFDMNNAIKQILIAKKESIIENILDNFSDVFLNFLASKENLLRDFCRTVNMYIGNEFYCKKINQMEYFEIKKNKFIPTIETKIDNYNHVYFEINFKKTYKVIEKKELKRMTKKHTWTILKTKALEIISEKYQGEDLEHFIYSGEYDWSDKIDD